MKYIFYIIIVFSISFFDLKAQALQVSCKQENNPNKYISKQTTTNAPPSDKVFGEKTLGEFYTGTLMRIYVLNENKSNLPDNFRITQPSFEARVNGKNRSKTYNLYENFSPDNKTDNNIYHNMDISNTKTYQSKPADLGVGFIWPPNVNYLNSVPVILLKPIRNF
ncbi:hypothetical protein [Helicobacter sp. 11S03491-1]|uniref:hypothetical protein n=1 Tax=Helicobacter sp. 11S03491-1 TaxID=1476196 RepID=UPI000BA54619|nr:hypothetical protein [Helicobacter sp. 11S03491-1]PAF42642.1 hypothetical protein BKH45_03785 [Helicobacter sp. 11S03491-1]